jgi:hypothetical protein
MLSRKQSQGDVGPPRYPKAICGAASIARLEVRLDCGTFFIDAPARSP